MLNSLFLSLFSSRNLETEIKSCLTDLELTWSTNEVVKSNNYPLCDIVMDRTEDDVHDINCTNNTNKKNNDILTPFFI